MDHAATTVHRERRSLRRRVHAALDGQRGAHTRGMSGASAAISLLIVFNVVALVLESMPRFAAYTPYFVAFEAFSVLVFSVEYVLRVWAAGEDARYAGFVGRLRFMRSPMAVIDLLAVLPFYLPWLGVDLRAFRSLRLFRLVRLAKLARYSAAMETFAATLRQKRTELTLMLGFLAVVVLCASSVMYFLERDAQPAVFSSIPASAWWTIITLTTIGYGDAVPVTSTGRAIGAVVALFGVGVVALPAGLLGAAFSNAISARREHEAQMAGDVVSDTSGDTQCPYCGSHLVHTAASQ